MVGFEIINATSNSTNGVTFNRATEKDSTYVRFTPGSYTIHFTAETNLGYILIGGGGKGQDASELLGYGSGGNAGQFINGSLTVPLGYKMNISVGNGESSTDAAAASDIHIYDSSNNQTDQYTAAPATMYAAGGLDGTGQDDTGLYRTTNSGVHLSSQIPSDLSYYCGGGGAGSGTGNSGGDGGLSGGNGGSGVSNNTIYGEPGYSPGSGGGGGSRFFGQETFYGTGGDGKGGLVVLYLPGTATGEPPSSTCFLAGTPVVTDQGEVAIDKIDVKVNTINGKRIVAITETPGTMDCLCLIQKDLLGENMPNKDTLISIWHKVLYNGEMTEAQDIPGVLPHEYNDQPLYNVLMDDHQNMIVNGLTVETLLPTHQVAKQFLQLCQKS